jgi:alkylation response protein AidB-like acyl-CoA dehydrogenase
MNFVLSDEQAQLRNSVQAYLAQRYPAALGRSAFSDSGYARQWQSLAKDLGIAGLALPQDRGGLGGDPVDTMVVMEEFGAALVVEPFIETVVIAGRLLAASSSAEPQAELDAIACGSRRYALAHSEAVHDERVATTATRRSGGWTISGRKSTVLAAPWAERLIVSARDEASGQLLLFGLDPDIAGVAMTPYATVDGRCAADVTFDGVLLDDSGLLCLDDCSDKLDFALDAARAAQGAEALGVMRRMVRDTIEYTQQRRQFGKALAEFQVLRHRMADMAIELENARSAVYLGTLKLTAPVSERRRAISAMKVTVARALRFVWQNALQLHGGMGMTEELALGHYAKRAIAIEQTYGTADWHLHRFATLRGEA